MKWIGLIILGLSCLALSVIFCERCWFQHRPDPEKPILLSDCRTAPHVRTEFSSNLVNLEIFQSHGADWLVFSPEHNLELSAHGREVRVVADVSFEALSCNYVDICFKLHYHEDPLQNATPKKSRSHRNSMLTIYWNNPGLKISKTKSIAQKLPQQDVDWTTYRFFLSEHPFWHGPIGIIGLALKGDCDLTVSRITFDYDPALRSEYGLSTRLRIGTETRPAHCLSPGQYFESSLPSLKPVVIEFGVAMPHSTQETLELFLTLVPEKGESRLVWSSVFAHPASTENGAFWQDITLSLDPGRIIMPTLRWTCKTISQTDSSQDGKVYLALSQPIIHEENPVSSRSYPNLVLVSLDTLRADHLGCYGYPVSISPWIDWLSRQGSLITQAITPYPSTAPAHISLMTGLFPMQHGVLKGKDRLSPEFPTLAEHLLKHNYQTFAVTGGGNVDAYHRIDKGFLSYDDGERSVLSLERKFLPKLKRMAASRFFGFYHTYEIHAPYPIHRPFIDYLSPHYTGPVTGEEFVSKIENISLDQTDLKHMVALYDAGIHYTDVHLHQFITTLIDCHLNDQTIVVIVADHGEHFAENGLYGHGNSLFSPLINVPIIIAGAGIVPAWALFDLKINLLDLPHTLTSLIGLPPFSTAVSRDFTRTIQDQHYPAQTQETYSELRTRSSERNSWIDGFAYIQDNYKLILTLPDGQKKLFILPSQESSADNIIDDEKEKTEHMERKLREFLMTRPQSRHDYYHEGEQQVDPKTERLLHALGYLD
ncbi:sulfatase [bacterium]|nr:sulfatase [bacterium]